MQIEKCNQAQKTNEFVFPCADEVGLRHVYFLVCLTLSVEGARLLYQGSGSDPVQRFVVSPMC